jgi:hypothetical protein
MSGGDDLGPEVYSDAVINAVAVVLEICSPCLRLIRFSPDSLDDDSVVIPRLGSQLQQCVFVERDEDGEPVSVRWDPDLLEVDASSMEQPESSEFGAETRNDYGRRLFPVIKRATLASREV